MTDARRGGAQRQPADGELDLLPVAVLGTASRLITRLGFREGLDVVQDLALLLDVCADGGVMVVGDVPCRIPVPPALLERLGPSGRCPAPASPRNAASSPPWAVSSATRLHGIVRRARRRRHLTSRLHAARRSCPRAARSRNVSSASSVFSWCGIHLRAYDQILRPTSVARPGRCWLFVFGRPLLLQSAWVLALPPFRGTDEFDHAYRAAEVAGGEWKKPRADARTARARRPHRRSRRDIVTDSAPDLREL